MNKTFQAIHISFYNYFFLAIVALLLNKPFGIDINVDSLFHIFECCYVEWN